MAGPINFPTPPQKSSYQGMTFPSDLITDDRQRYCSLGLIKYEVAAQFNTSIVRGGGSIRLPMPNSIIETNAQNWARDVQLNPVAGMFGALQIGSGEAINPWMFWQYKSPTFRDFQLEWTLLPVNEKESDTIRDIIKMLKHGSYPDQSTSGAGQALLTYPDILQVSFEPDDYLFKFKPCVIQSVTVNYTAAGQQAWFKKNDAPVAIQLSLAISEIQWWTKSNDDV